MGKDTSDISVCQLVNCLKCNFSIKCGGSSMIALNVLSMSFLPFCIAIIHHSSVGLALESKRKLWMLTGTEQFWISRRHNLMHLLFSAPEKENLENSSRSFDRFWAKVAEMEKIRLIELIEDEFDRQHFSSQFFIDAILWRADVPETVWTISSEEKHRGRNEEDLKCVVKLATVSDSRHFGGFKLSSSWDWQHLYVVLKHF